MSLVGLQREASSLQSSQDVRYSFRALVAALAGCGAISVKVTPFFRWAHAFGVGFPMMVAVQLPVLLGVYAMYKGERRVRSVVSGWAGVWLAHFLPRRESLASARSLSMSQSLYKRFSKCRWFDGVRGRNAHELCDIGWGCVWGGSRRKLGIFAMLPRKGRCTRDVRGDVTR